MLFQNEADKTTRILHVEPHKDSKLILTLFNCFILILKCLPITDPEMPCLNEHCIFASNDILNSIDRTVNPCEDFYGFSW